MTESFWTLVRSAAHWEFELALMLVVDGILLGVVWPLVGRRLARFRWHHTEDHAELDELRARISALETELHDRFSSEVAVHG